MTSSTARVTSVLLAGTLLLLLGGTAHAQDVGYGPCPAFRSSTAFTAAPSGDYAVLLSFDSFIRCMKLSINGSTYNYTYYDTAQPNPTKQSVNGTVTFVATDYVTNGYLRLSGLKVTLLGGDPFGNTTLRAVYYGPDYQVYATCIGLPVYHITYAIAVVPLSAASDAMVATIKNNLQTANFPNAVNLYTTYSSTMCTTTTPILRCNSTASTGNDSAMAVTTEIRTSVAVP